MASIVVIDYGSQYTRLITRRLRELNVYSVIVPPTVSPAELDALEPAGFILSGGPQSVTAAGAPGRPASLLERDVPVLAICYGMQLLARDLGDHVEIDVADEGDLVDLGEVEEHVAQAPVESMGVGEEGAVGQRVAGGHGVHLLQVGVARFGDVHLLDGDVRVLLHEGLQGAPGRSLLVFVAPVRVTQQDLLLAGDGALAGLRGRRGAGAEQGEAGCGRAELQELAAVKRPLWGLFCLHFRLLHLGLEM